MLQQLQVFNDGVRILKLSFQAEFQCHLLTSKNHTFGIQAGPIKNW